MKNLRSFSVLIAGMALMFLACSKGDSGPAGPQGPAGPDSVIHSKWIALNMTMDLTFSPPDTAWDQTISAPALTQKILDSGIVLTYLSIQDNTNATLVFNASSYFLSEVFSPGQIDVVAPADFTGVNFRYVIIPGSTTAGTVTSGPAKGLTVSELKTMSYSVVQKMIGESNTKVTSQ